MSRSRMVLVLALGAALWALSGCTWEAIDESDAGTIQVFDVGDGFRISLQGNPSTGYEWVRTEPASLAGTPLELVKEGDYKGAGGPLVGAPGVFEFGYRAVASGTIVLAFEYRRPWEPEAPVDTFSVTIWVR